MRMPKIWKAQDKDEDFSNGPKDSSLREEGITTTFDSSYPPTTGIHPGCDLFVLCLFLASACLESYHTKQATYYLFVFSVSFCSSHDLVLG
jgi:hypothetical protein